MFKKTTLYKLILTMLLIATPLAMQAQKSNDINKPTRERVKDKDKNSTKKTQATNTESSKKSPAAATADQTKKAPAAATEQKGNTKAAASKDDKKDDKKDANTAPAANQNKTAEKPANDTTAKKAAETKPSKPKRVDASTVQFDGIDISKHQGNINWAELKSNYNIKFIYIKATEGSSHNDPRYKEYIKAARKHGFKVGSYHFFRTTSSAQDQFLNFVKTVNREEQDLLPMIDIEEKKNWTEQQLRDSVKVFADLVESYYGCKPLIYTGEKFYNNFLGLAFKHYPLFIAKYSPTSPNVNTKWTMWQFSESGIFKGVNTTVDMSRFNTGCSVKDIAYVPSRHTPKKSVLDLVNRKPAPANVTMTEQKKAPTAEELKRQKEKDEEKAKADKRIKEREKAKQKADEEAKKKEAEKKAAADKRIADKKAAEKKAAEAAKKKEAEKKAAAEKRAAEKKAAEKAKQEAKDKRKAEAQKARNQKKANQSTGKTNKSASLLQGSSSKLTQSQRNDSIRNANLKGRKTNKSSADND